MSGRARAALLLAVALLCLAAAESNPEQAAEAGRAAMARGDLPEAVRAWARAADAYEAAGDPDAELLARVRLASALRAQGNLRDADAALARARVLAEAGGDPVRLATVRGAQGDLAVAAGDRETAARELEAAAALAASAGAKPLEAALRNNLGNHFASTGDLARARDAYARAAELAAAADDRALAARARANAARAAVDAGAASEAAALVMATRPLLEGEPPSHAQALLRLHLARTLDRARRAGAGPADVLRLQSHALLVEAQAIATTVGDAQSAVYAQGYLGALYEEEGRNEEALELTRRALFEAQRLDEPVSLPLWLAQAGRLEAASGRTDDAIGYYAAAVAALQELRHTMAVRYAGGGESFRERVGHVYFDYVDLLLQRARVAPDAAAAQADLALAQQTVELLKAAELRDYYRDECVDSALARRVSAADTSPRAAIVYPILLQDRIELLVSSPAGIHRAAVDVPAARARPEIRRFRQLLEKRSTREYLRPAQQLHDWLVAPIEPHLRSLGVDTLVFVPDAALRAVPMAALHDGERFLVERYALAVTPGLELTDPRPLDREKLRVFLGGLSAGEQGYSALPEVRAELRAIKALYGGELLLDDAFVASEVEARLRSEPFTVVHIASHAQFSSDPDATFVLTHEGRLSMDALVDSVGAFRYRETPLELITLSACETARGDERAALGLSGLAVKAGARSALGTLWRVNDVAASRLVVGFYERLGNPDLSRAGALQGAQLELMAEPVFRHPAHWAAFLLIGNWL